MNEFHRSLDSEAPNNVKRDSPMSVKGAAATDVETLKKQTNLPADHNVHRLFIFRH